MPQTSKQQPKAGPTAVDRARRSEALRRREAREDAEAAQQDRPGTSMPAQRERWENEGGAPAGVISATDTAEPRKSDD